MKLTGTPHSILTGILVTVAVVATACDASPARQAGGGSNSAADVAPAGEVANADTSDTGGGHDVPQRVLDTLEPAGCTQELWKSLQVPFSSPGDLQGIAGIIGFKSDNCTCTTGDGCPWLHGSAMIYLWSLTDDIATVAAIEEHVVSQAPFNSSKATGDYAFPLDTGSYLLCVGSADPDLEGEVSVCTVLPVDSNVVTTAHVLVPYGDLFNLSVFDPGQSNPREVGVFAVSATVKSIDN